MKLKKSALVRLYPANINASAAFITQRHLDIFLTFNYVSVDENFKKILVNIILFYANIIENKKLSYSNRLACAWLVP